MPGSFRTIELSAPRFEREDLRFMTVKTPHLQGRGDICLFVPEGENLPIYLLLHGVYGSAWSWALQGGAHLTAQRLIAEGTIRPAILAMPSDGLWGDGSAYFSHHARQFDQWIVADVPQAILENIPQASQAPVLCIGGLSMGGFGALSLGGRFPERFNAISGHSSITQLDQMAQFVEEPLDAYTAECLHPDVFDSLLAHQGQLPPIRFDCGREDELFAANEQLHQQLTTAGISHQFEALAGGHEWAYWERNLEKTLRFFDQAVQDS